MQNTMIEQIRDNCLENLENTYASRLEVLVSEDRYDDAQSIVSEMVVDDESEDSEWTFVDDMSQYNDDDIPNLRWIEIE